MPYGDRYGIDYPAIHQGQEAVKSSRLTNRINEMRYTDALQKSDRATQRGNILAGAVGPQGRLDTEKAQRDLMAGGLIEEAYDFKKIEDASQQSTIAIEQGLATLKGTKLTNAKKQFNVLGLGMLGLTEAYNSSIESGTSRPESIIKIQPLLEDVNAAFKAAGLPEESFMKVFDPEMAVMGVRRSTEAMNILNAQETRAGAKATRKAAAAEKVYKHKEAKVKSKADADKRLSAIAKDKAILLSRDKRDPNAVALYGEIGIDADNIDAVKDAIKQYDREARNIRKRFNIGPQEHPINPAGSYRMPTPVTQKTDYKKPSKTLDSIFGG